MSPWKQKTNSYRTKQIVRKLISWGKKNYRPYPWRDTASEFHALIAEIMLQRTKAEQVLSVYSRFTQKYKTPDDVCSDSPENVIVMLKPLGLDWRAKKIIEFSTETKMNAMPKTFSELIKLPGVGQYTTSAFLSLHKDERYPLIDSNTVRVWGRVFGLETNSETRRKKKFKELADSLTPQTNFKAFNYALLDFGSLVCKTVPLCKTCPINKMCCYFQDNLN